MRRRRGGSRAPPLPPQRSQRPVRGPTCALDDSSRGCGYWRLAEALATPSLLLLPLPLRLCPPLRSSRATAPAQSPCVRVRMRLLQPQQLPPQLPRALAAYRTAAAAATAAPSSSSSSRHRSSSLHTALHCLPRAACPSLLRSTPSRATRCASSWGRLWRCQSPRGRKRSSASSTPAPAPSSPQVLAGAWAGGSGATSSSSSTPPMLQPERRFPAARASQAAARRPRCSRLPSCLSRLRLQQRRRLQQRPMRSSREAVAGAGGGMAPSPLPSASPRLSTPRASPSSRRRSS